AQAKNGSNKLLLSDHVYDELPNQKQKNKQNAQHFFYFENLYLYKFLFHLNKINDYMTFNEGYKKYLKFKSDFIKNKNGNMDAFPAINIQNYFYGLCDDLIEEQMNIELDTVSESSATTITGTNQINIIINQQVSIFYEFLINKLLNLNYTKFSNLFKEIIIFIDSKLKKSIDIKYIFNHLIYFIYNKQNKVLFINEIYLLNLFNKAFCKIKLDNSMKIFVLSKINEIVKILLQRYYFYLEQENQVKENQIRRLLLCLGDGTIIKHKTIGPTDSNQVQKINNNKEIVNKQMQINDTDEDTLVDKTNEQNDIAYIKADIS
ncbi:conserved protein, unknown function, partial [Hepatocystis sp. ex Piliocolobus tephrosceles]